MNTDKQRVVEKTDNELIAEFMGWEKLIAIDWSITYFHELPIPDPSVSQRITELHYDKSFSWLMPVVEKIFQLGLSSDSEVTHKATIVCSSPICDTIENHYKRIFEFIKWYSHKVKTDTEV